LWIFYQDQFHTLYCAQPMKLIDCPKVFFSFLMNLLIAIEISLYALQ
jgi:hypothetical protein